MIMERQPEKKMDHELETGKWNFLGDERTGRHTVESNSRRARRRSCQDLSNFGCF